ncbi:M14 family metallopeptidase [Petrotoga sp. 9PWA.NaAc.5.4]|uniref:M14 family metallopeptidase n=1 Tax=Petrotoga sp. 9PWA.NaAc.5.4 TaxID=1434328 RepID=UPI001304DAD7|nr:M14 family metallopeptidase [Petrotoga sp. 9PWA.NaAc.5.4]
MYNYHFDYNNCRKEFMSFKDDLSKYYSLVSKECFLVEEDCYIDSFRCENQTNDKILLITTGLHGIEGYAGNVFLQIFVKEFLSLIKHDKVSLFLIHSINPWGMKNKRRVNENNVDLNRNFLFQNNDLENESYLKMRKYFKKQRLVKTSDLNLVFSFFQLLPYLTSLGIKGITEALTKGQYIDENSVYYGGRLEQKETKYLKEVYEKIYNSYGFVLHFDIHTGAGPKNKMIIVNSSFYNDKKEKLEKDFEYSPITKVSKDSFYDISGDMIDYIYKKYQNVSNFYSTCFEYGTLGEGLIGQLKSLKTLILENQAFYYGTKNSRIQSRIDKLFKKMFFPEEKIWKENFENDSKSALRGILKYFGFIVEN